MAARLFWNERGGIVHTANVSLHLKQLSPRHRVPPWGRQLRRCACVTAAQPAHAYIHGDAVALAPMRVIVCPGVMPDRHATAVSICAETWDMGSTCVACCLLVLHDEHIVPYPTADTVRVRSAGQLRSHAEMSTAATATTMQSAQPCETAAEPNRPAASIYPVRSLEPCQPFQTHIAQLLPRHACADAARTRAHSSNLSTARATVSGLSLPTCSTNSLAHYSSN